MDESPAMKQCWECMVSLHDSPMVSGQCREIQTRSTDVFRRRKVQVNNAQVSSARKPRVSTALGSLVQELSKVHFFRTHYEFIGDYFKRYSKFFSLPNPLDSLPSLTQSMREKTLGASRSTKSDCGPLLASATTTALAQLNISAPSSWPHSLSDELQSENWSRERSFDAFLDGRDLGVSNSGKERPAWIKEPSKSTLALAEELAENAVEGWSGFIRPVDHVWQVSSGFGPRWGRQHNGVDLAAPIGEPVLASDSGEVTYVGYEPSGYGYLVEITHRDGWRTLYAHNSEIFTWEGRLVRRGECIATVGETGSATGPHLHWEIRNQNNKPVNPSDHMKL